MSALTTHEREITAACALADARGRVNPEAIGWSRRPLQRAALGGHWGRRKRWNYWAVLEPRFMLALTLADVDYLGLAVVSFVDLRTGELTERAAVVPLGLGVRLPDDVAGLAGYEGLGVLVRMEGDALGTRLVARCRARGGVEVDVDVVVRRPPGHETLNVVVPWSARRFQLTSKQTALVAEGSVRRGGEVFALGAQGPAFAVLDYGRGRWPYRTTWNWAAASGVSAGRTIGLNLGGRWTRGTGMTENALCIDGRLHKLGDELEFTYSAASLARPWRVRDPAAGRVDLELRPIVTRRVGANAIVLGSELRHAIGTFDGEIVADDGERIAVRGLQGWAEEHRARW